MRASGTYLLLFVSVTACSGGSSDGDSSSGGDHATSTGGSQGNGGTGGTTSAGGAAVGGAGGTSGADGTGGGALTSDYELPCQEEGDACGTSGMSCVGFSFGGGALSSLACSATCPGGLDDCPPVPEGYATPRGCLTFTTAKRCVLVCEAEGEEFPCPNGMSCVGDSASTISRCVWL